MKRSHTKAAGVVATLCLLLTACGANPTASEPSNSGTTNPGATTQAGGAGIALTVGQLVSFQVTTPGFTNRFLRHANSLAFTEIVTASSGDVLKNDATWKIVPGLDGTPCYSFESKNYPGEYLRHSGFRLRKDRSDNTDTFRKDATFCAQTGFGSAGGVSLVSRNFPGYYIRHFNSEVYIAKVNGGQVWDSAASYNDDISWNLASPWSNTTGGGTLLPPAPAGKINVRVLNGTNGAYPDSQVYWAVIGFNPATNRLSYVNRNGQLVDASPADNDAANRLVKNNINYANYFNRVSEASVVTLPKIYGARMFLSVGSPMFIKILGVPGGVGFAGPDINNPSDPNQDVYFDFAEFTYNDLGYFGNTTRVDQFGFPLRMRLAAFDGYDRTLGENVSREQILRDFENLPQTEFRPLVRRPYRIVAPKAGEFAAGRSRANYFDPYVNQVWDYYRTRDLVFTTQAGTFRGRVTGNDFVFSKNGGPATLYIRGKPSSIGIFEASGNLASGNSDELVVQAQIAAALNRHLLIDVDPAQWSTPSTYYRNAPANYFAKFWHDHSIDGLAYGFAYDDVREQSTLLQRPNPRQVDIIVGW